MSKPEIKKVTSEIKPPSPKVEAPVLPKTEEPAAQPKVEETKPNLYVSTSVRHVNPFTQDIFNPGEPIEATEDNWLSCQVSAGLIKGVF